MTDIAIGQAHSAATAREREHDRARAGSGTFPPGALWITWERHRRTRELSDSLQVHLIEVLPRWSPRLRYASLLWQTTACLVRQRPAVLVIQCPSVLLALWVSIMKPLFRYRLVADLHNEAVEPFNYSGAIYAAALKYIQRRADVSVVSNDALKGIVDATGGRGFVLPDKLPNIAPSPSHPGAKPRPQVVFVCTYAADEPVAEVIEAGRLIGPSIDLHVTGDRRRLKAGIPVPLHVHLTGYLPDHEYEQLLQQADVIVDLTRMENCLVCGAYEAVALGKPLVTSDTGMLRRYFSLGTVYSAHDPAALRDAIGSAISQRDRLAAEMARLKDALDADWTQRRDALCACLEGEVL